MSTQGEGNKNATALSLVSWETFQSVYTDTTGAPEPKGPWVTGSCTVINRLHY